MVCSHCGSQLEASAVLKQLELFDETARACPLCSRPLFNARLAGYPLACCARCFGMLIDMNLFVAVIEAARACEEHRVRTVPPPQQHAEQRLLTCPSCGQPMDNHAYGGPGNVTIDTCERCLVNWLDAGELRRIAIAPGTI